MDNHYFHRLIQTIGIHLTNEQLDQFRLFAETLVQWNKKINITRITSIQDISIKHFFDSLSALPFINQNGCESILDVGSGGGFPGVPLSIVLPDTRVTLLDSARKRVHFLKYVSQILGLQNTHVCHERLETFNPEKRYDIIISRAFSEISYFVNLSKVFLNDFGRIIAMKGQHVYNELQMFDASSFHVTIESYTLPVINQKRYLVILALQ
jgi:16S rRNA (guanine527-N7)-methyltransferase